VAAGTLLMTPRTLVQVQPLGSPSPAARGKPVRGLRPGLLAWSRVSLPHWRDRLRHARARPAC
jgi:hypothetical protein